MKNLFNDILDLMMLISIISVIVVGIIGTLMLLLSSPLIGLPVAIVTGVLLCNLLESYMM